MNNERLPSAKSWGYGSGSRAPEELLAAVRAATMTAIQGRAAWPEDREPCADAPGYHRTSVAIPLSEQLADELMNGPTGYRAHYAVDARTGEAFNRALVEAVAPIVVEAEHLYQGRLSPTFCRHSLLGQFSKFWFPKELTDPSAQERLLERRAVIRHPPWVKYWSAKPRPHKGLLAPIAEGGFVLLNGTFVDESGEHYEQKARRSEQLAERGWT